MMPFYVGGRGQGIRGTKSGSFGRRRQWGGFAFVPLLSGKPGFLLGLGSFFGNLLAVQESNRPLTLARDSVAAGSVTCVLFDPRKCNQVAVEFRDVGGIEAVNHHEPALPDFTIFVAECGVVCQKIQEMRVVPKSVEVFEHEIPLVNERRIGRAGGWLDQYLSWRCVECEESNGFSMRQLAPITAANSAPTSAMNS